MRKQKKQRPPVENQPAEPLETAVVPTDEPEGAASAPEALIAEAPVAETVVAEVPVPEVPTPEIPVGETPKEYPTDESPLYAVPAPDLPAPETPEACEACEACGSHKPQETQEGCTAEPCIPPQTESYSIAGDETQPETDTTAPEPETSAETMTSSDVSDSSDAQPSLGPLPDIRDIAEVDELVDDGSRITIPVEAETPEPVATPSETDVPVKEPAAVAETGEGTQNAEAPVAAENVEIASVVAAVATPTEPAEKTELTEDLPPLEDEPRTAQAQPESAAPTKAAVVATSVAGKCFNALAWLGPLAALLILAAQTLPGIDLRALMDSEAVLPALLESMKHGADPLLLLLNGAPYPDLPPAYFWFLAGLDSLWQLTPLPYSMPLLLLGSSVVAGFLLLLMTWLLARVCGSDVREAFAACAVLLCTVVVCAMTRLALPDLLFAACVTASCLCLYSGWMRTRAPLTLLIGFLLAGLAMLIEGPVGLVLPLGASLLFLLWRGTFRRAGAIDGAFGFAVLLVGIGGWLAWLGLTYGRGPAEALLNFHIPQWSLAFWSDPQLWLEALLMLGVLLLPWPLLLLFLPWERLYRLPVLLWRNRRENPGIGFVWSALLVGLVILSLTCTGGTAGFAPLLPFLAVILGRAVLRLSPLRSKGFFGLIGIVMFVGAVALGLCSALPFLTDWLPAGLTLPEACKAIADLPGMPFVAGATLLFAFILLKLTDKTFPGGGLLVLVLFATVVMQPVAVFTMPYLAPLNATETAPAVTPVPAAPTETPTPPAPPAEKAAPEAPVAPAETSVAPTATPDAPAAPEAPAETPAETPAPAAETPAAS